MFNNKETFKQVFTEQLVSRLGKGLEEATAEDVYKTLGGMIREYVGREWAAANRIYRETGQKQVYYFSQNFDRAVNGKQSAEPGCAGYGPRGLLDLGWNLDEIEEQEPDADSATGLGRLAACFLDSLASLSYAGHGCGIRYKYGLFEQKIIDGHQVERRTTGFSGATSGKNGGLTRRWKCALGPRGGGCAGGANRVSHDGL